MLVFAGWCGLTAAAVLVPLVGGSPWLLAPVLMLVGAGILGLHPVYYALAQELPAKHMGVLSGVLAAMTWVTVGSRAGRDRGAHQGDRRLRPRLRPRRPRALWRGWWRCSCCGSRQRQNLTTEIRWTQSRAEKR